MEISALRANFLLACHLNDPGLFVLPINNINMNQLGSVVDYSSFA